jgi:hypothetical protein
MQGIVRSAALRRKTENRMRGAGCENRSWPPFRRPKSGDFRHGWRTYPTAGNISHIPHLVSRISFPATASCRESRRLLRWPQVIHVVTQAISSAMYVLSNRFFGEPITSPTGANFTPRPRVQPTPGRPASRSHALGSHNPEQRPPLCANGLSQDVSPRHCGGGIADFFTSVMSGSLQSCDDRHCPPLPSPQFKMVRDTCDRKSPTILCPNWRKNGNVYWG